MLASAPLWSALLVPAILAAFATVAVMTDTLLASGRPLASTAIRVPKAELARALVGQRRTTRAPDALLWRLGVVTVPAAGVLAAIVIPFGGATVSRMSVGVVWFNAMEVLTWAGVWLAGWGPNSALSLVGGYRYVAQGLAYELPVMFALITAATGAGSLSVADIVVAQRHLWFVTWMPAAFLLFLGGVYAFSFLGPFAYPAGSDLAGGVVGELSGVDRLLLQAGRWLLLSAGAGMAVALFLGGGQGPVLPAWLWSALKTFIVLFLLVWMRRRVPTVRADRYVELAWVLLLPLAVLQALVAALVVLGLGGAP
jgi:NADH-quinone oxidoreductase subunit H